VRRRLITGLFPSPTCSTARMTQRGPWIRSALPGIVGHLERFGLTGGLPNPNALLEQIWNTLLRSVLAASHTFGKLPSEELFQRIRRGQPLKPDLTPII
jgi:hypothetical protein